MPSIQFRWQALEVDKYTSSDVLGFKSTLNILIEWKLKVNLRILKKTFCYWRFIIGLNGPPLLFMYTAKLRGTSTDTCGAPWCEQGVNSICEWYRLHLLCLHVLASSWVIWNILFNSQYNQILWLQLWISNKSSRTESIIQFNICTTSSTKVIVISLEKTKIFKSQWSRQTMQTLKVNYVLHSPLEKFKTLSSLCQLNCQFWSVFFYFVGLPSLYWPICLFLMLLFNTGVYKTNL